jgi:hypothetical protein
LSSHQSHQLEASHPLSEKKDANAKWMWLSCLFNAKQRRSEEEGDWKLELSARGHHEAELGDLES